MPFHRIVGMVVAALAVLAAPLSGAVIQVAAGATQVDAGDGVCSLIEAVENALDGAQTHADCTAGSAGTDTLVLQASIYTLLQRDNAAFGFNGLPSIDSHVIIEGSGATLERSAGAPAFRLLHVAVGGQLELRDLWLRGGRAAGGGGGGGGAGLGGAVVNEGTLLIERCTISANVAVGGSGASANNAGQHGGGGLGGNGGLGGSAGGGGGGGQGGNGGPGGVAAGGGGGGSQVAGDGAGGDAGGAGGAQNGGNGGGGGGAGLGGGPGGGGGGGGGFAFGGSGGLGGGGGGSGLNASGGDGGFGGGGGDGAISGGDGGFGGGGGGFFTGAAGTGGFGAGDGAFAASGGGGAFGGAIYNHEGATLELRNSTLRANQALGGGGGGSAQSGSGLGGAVFNRNGTVTLLNVTLASNDASDGGALYNLGDDLIGGGSGLGSMTVRNSILADSVGANDCQDLAIGGGSTSFVSTDNLIESNGACPAPSVTGDPQLGVLQLNAPGLTPTLALAPTSPALDQGSSCLANDQRGVARLAACDLGAYELASFDLTLAHTESADPVVAGSGPGNLVYVITIGNQGPFDATEIAVSLDLTLPVGTSASTITPSGSTTYSAGLWSIDALAVSSSETLTVTLDVGASTASGSDVIDSTATIDSAGGELLNTGDDDVFEATSVSRQVDLALSQSESVDPVVAGSGAGNLVYVVTLSNNGPSDATQVEILSALGLPSGVNLDAAVPSAGVFASSTWTLALLPAGGAETLTLTLTVGATAPPGVDTIQSAASVQSAAEPLVNLGDDAVLTTTSVLGPAIFEDDFETGNLVRWSGHVP